MNMVEYRLILPLFIDPQLSIMSLLDDDEFKLLTKKKKWNYDCDNINEFLNKIKKLRTLYVNLAHHIFDIGAILKDFLYLNNHSFFKSTDFLRNHLYKEVNLYFSEIILERIFEELKKREQMEGTSYYAVQVPANNSSKSKIEFTFIDCLLDTFCNDENVIINKKKWGYAKELLWIALLSLTPSGNNLMWNNLIDYHIEPKELPNLPELITNLKELQNWDEILEKVDKNWVGKDSILLAPMPKTVYLSPWILLATYFSWKELFYKIKNEWQGNYFVSASPYQGTYYKKVKNSTTDENFSEFSWDLSVEVICYLSDNIPFEKYVTEKLRFRFLQDAIFYTKAGIPFMPDPLINEED